LADISVLFDREKIQQLLLNLILNAVQASKKGSSITVSLTRRDTGVELSVADHGEGIDPELTDRVFEPFYTTKTSGSGLGLAVVKSIVDDHSGEIKLESQPGVGTTFTVRLPTIRSTS